MPLVWCGITTLDKVAATKIDSPDKTPPCNFWTLVFGVCYQAQGIFFSFAKIAQNFTAL